VDIPSGISADTGEVLGTAIEADRTITISLPKVGLALEPGAQHAGEISVARVGIVDPAPLRSDPVALWSRQAAAARLPSRASDGHKGRFGHVLVVAGSTGKAGAGVLTSRAAVRAGAGLVTLAHPVGLEHELGALPVEVMTSPVGEAVEGCLSRASLEALSGLAAARDVVALGPGLGSGAAVVEWVADWVDSLERPLVLDADGLNAIVGRLDGLKRRSAPTVLTPHPGEASRLLGCTTRAINADRVGAARQLARDSGSVVVLKGARTVIADAVGRVRITPTGGPVLATGGTGDVLTGIVAALLAAGLDAFDAAGLAAWWHGAAADGTPQARVGFGLLASEVADALPATAESMRAESGGEPGDPLVLRFP
jgi:NAD(P)H-hydrate epimerase